MQLPAQFLPTPASQSLGSPAHPVLQTFDAAELDLGYEGAFPFLTEDEVTEVGGRF